MLQETAIVVAVQGDTLWVETESRSACSHCSSGECTSSVLGKLFGARRNRLQLDNCLDARPGDQVVIGIPDGLLVRASLWGYLVPLLAMMCAALAGKSWGFSDGGQSILALLGLVSGLFGVRWVQNGMTARRRFQPKLLRIAPRFKGVRPLGRM